jgi:hypothetical protein
MNTELSVKRDERTVAVQNASYKWAYYFLAWPLVIDTFYRQHALHEEVGDLVALVCASGIIGIGYMVIHKAWAWDQGWWPWRIGGTVLVFAACIVAAILISVLSVIVVRQ